MRMPPNDRVAVVVDVAERASMRGGMRMPPNQESSAKIPWLRAASMRGGMRMPPNDWQRMSPTPHGYASMRGGMRMPPNLRVPGNSRTCRLRFNEGRHAHAAECHHAALTIAGTVRLQ